MFTGTYTAIVTPFNQDGSIDYGALKALVAWQIESGVDGIVPVGTTGESPTLDHKEHMEVIRVAAEAARGHLRVIAGTGANATAEALSLTREAIEIGVDGTLQVTPYYNKPNQEGLYRHFATIAELGLPVILYNVPGRCSREIELSTVVRLAQTPNVVAVKEAGGSVDRVSAIRNACDLTVLSGDDSLALPMIAVGAQGVISVASNVAPAEVADMIRKALNGDLAQARLAHLRLYPLFRDLFIDTNPIMIKAAMAAKGLIGEFYRLPLCETSAKNREQITTTLKKLGLIN